MSKSEWLPVTSLRMDPSYQDRRRSKQVERLVATDFDWRLFGELEGSRRLDEDVYIIDGWTRVRGCLCRDPSMSVPVLVHEGLTVAEEAEIFWRADAQRKPLRPFDRFRARVVAGDIAAIEIENTLIKHDLHVADSDGDGVVKAIVTLQQIHGIGGPELLNRTLETVIGAWGRQTPTFNAYILSPVARVLRLTGVDPWRLMKILSLHSPEWWIAQGRVLATNGRGGDAASSVRQIMYVVLDAYNKGLRSNRVEMR